MSSSPGRQLACPSGCTDGRFEAVNAPMLVDARGRYLSHDDSAASFVCVLCRGIAIDVASAAAEMRSAGDSSTLSLTCPACGMVMLPPEDADLVEALECPACSVQFTVDEAMPHLFGTGFDESVDYES